MKKYITLDSENKVISIRFGRDIVEGEIESEAGDLGQVMLEDGTFFTPEPEPIEPRETMEDKLSRIEATNFILMDALATVYEEVLMLRAEVGGSPT